MLNRALSLVANQEQHAARTAMNMSNSIDVIAPEEVELYREAAMLAREALHEELRNSSHAVSLEDGALLPAFPRELEDVAPVGSVLPPGAEVEVRLDSKYFFRCWILPLLGSWPFDVLIPGADAATSTPAPRA